MTGTLSPSLVSLPFWYNSLDERQATDRTCPILGEECSIISFPLCLALWRSPPVVYAVESSSAGSCGSRRVALRARKRRPHSTGEESRIHFSCVRVPHRKQAVRHCGWRRGVPYVRFYLFYDLLYDFTRTSSPSYRLSPL